MKSGESIGGIIGKVEENVQINISNCNNNVNMPSGTYIGGIIGKINGEKISANIINCSNKEDGEKKSLRCAGGAVGVIETMENIKIYAFDNNIGLQMSGEECYGGILGKAVTAKKIEIEDAILEGSIHQNGGSYISGIIGRVENADEVVINKSNNNISITGGYSVGALGAYISSNSLKITNSNNYGPIESSMYASGFIATIANSKVQILNCENNGELKTEGMAGGVIADTQNSDIYIDKCKNNGEILGTRSDGSNYAGGILGYCNSDMEAIIIKNSQNNSKITNYNNAGGILGDGGSAKIIQIENCINKEEINCGENESVAIVGGIIARLHVTETGSYILNCKNYGNCISKNVSARYNRKRRTNRKN